MRLELAAFFRERPSALSLYEALERAALAACPGAHATVQKTQISLAARHGFACVSLPRRASDTGLIVTLGLAYRLDSPRVTQAVEPYPMRWTHHIPIRDADEIDCELLGWLSEAYWFSEGKK